MNNPIRKVSMIAAAMFAALLIASSTIQFALVGDLRDRQGNRRALLASYGRERGSILADSTPIARSEKSDDEFKYLRSYPRGRLYSHITGYYSIIAGIGGGLERTEDALLSGSSDMLFYRRLGDMLTGRQPTGVSLELTINPKAQQAADAALGDQRGAVVALDPKTGAILAMVSHPAYDPNTLSSHAADSVTKAWETLLADPGRPLVNRAIGGNLYPPGSTFKVITAAAALASGKYQADTKVEAGAALKLPTTTSVLRNSGGGACNGGSADLATAFAKSCNTSFGAIGMDLGADALRDQAAKFGFGADLNIPMTVTTSRIGNPDNEPKTAFTAIGQQDVQVTPLQMAMVAAGVANGGSVMTPHLVKQTRGADLQVLDTTAASELSRAMDESVASTLTDMMTKVVDSGTGTRAQISGVKVAGKSGTAEHGSDASGNKRDPHAWFISFAPADDPQVAVAVVVEDGGNAGSEAAGGRISAPIAREVMKAVIDK